jgi:gamma-glutamylcyclotransferase (GGCT)/AIG2-like uncharacterized protein YtfP
VSPIVTLFAYGTLLPGDVRWHFLQEFVTDEGLVDRADGTLFDTGEGYPAAVFGSGSVIQGRAFTLVVDRIDDALATLDEVEGAVVGDYRRVEIVTHGGREAWAYAYGGGLQLAPIAGGSWAAHRAGSA